MPAASNQGAPAAFPLFHCTTFLTPLPALECLPKCKGQRLTDLKTAFAFLIGLAFTYFHGSTAAAGLDSFAA